MYLNLGAEAPKPKLIIERPNIRPTRPTNSDYMLHAAAKRLGERDFNRYYETVPIVGEKPKPLPDTLPNDASFSYYDVKTKLSALNKRFIFKEDWEGRIVLTLPIPSQHAVALYEADPSHIRSEADSYKEIPGPQVKLIAISTGMIYYRTDILSRVPCQLIARSLLSIVKAGVLHGGFTMAAAEKAFARKFRGVSLKKSYVNMTPLEWSKKRDTALITAGAV